MNYSQWAVWSKENAQQLSISVENLSQLLQDPNATTWMQGLTAAQQQRIKSLIAAIQSLHAALTPEIKQLLGII